MAFIEHLKQLVKNRQVPRVLALGGNEQALIDDALIMLKELHRAEDPDGLNYHRYSASEKTFRDLLTTLETPPFLSQNRYVELTDAEKFDGTAIDQLILYIKNPAPFSVFVLIFSKVDKRNKLFNILQEEKLFYTAEIDEKELSEYIKTEAQHYGMVIDNEVSSYMLAACDSDLLSIKTLLKKLSLSFENKSVSLEDALLHMAGEGMPDVFKLARLIAEGDLKASLKALALIRERENAVQFLGVLIWQFRVLLHIRHSLDRGMKDWDIRKEVSVYGDRFSWMLRVAKKRVILFHINRLTRLLKFDLMLKTQKIAEPWTLIERAVYQSVL